MPNRILSAVVIGRDEGERLARCLRSIRTMRVPEGGLELIYVDSGSRDQSRQVATDFGAIVVALQSGRFTAARARNAGWPRASAPYIFFVDGDSVVQPDFAAHALPLFQDPRVAVVFGLTRELFPKRSIFHRMQDVQWQHYGTDEVDHCMGSALVRRSALEAVDGYDSSMAGCEEGELCGRLGRRGFIIRRIDSLMVQHDLAMTDWRQYWWRMFRNSYGIAETVDRFAPGGLPSLRRRWRHTIVWGSLTAALPVIAAVCSAALASWIPLGIVLGFLAGLLLKTAWKTRRKEGDLLSWLAFSFHRYFREIPRLAGLIHYYRDKRRSRRSFVDYKAGSCTAIELAQIKQVSGSYFSSSHAGQETTGR